MIRALILALAISPLAACGFAPVYGPEPALSQAGPVKVLEIKGRTGHFLRQELVREVGQGVPGVKGSAQLEVSVSQRIERLAFKPDQAASRSDYIGDAGWSLRSSDGALIVSGSVTERASFNFADAAYADIAAQSAAQERLASLLARSIYSQILVEIGKKTAESAPAKPAAASPATGQ